MIIPTVHLNGSGKDNLVSGLCNAAQALDAAYDALRQCSPHPRDYYIEGDGVYKAAVREHDARIDKVVEIRNELRAIAEAISEQGER